MTTTLIELFKSTFHRDTILAWARDCGAVARLRKIHPQDFALSLVGCALGDEKRSVATARRLFDRIAGFMPEESSFYDRFTVEMADLMRRLFLRALGACSLERREALAKMLGGTGILDVLAIDGSQVSLPSSAVEVLPSTSDAHGGFKLTATLSLLFQKVQRVDVTDARTHDRKALALDRWLHGQLLLLDRGYSDHRLFKTIADRKGFFLTRLKESSVPVITAIRSGLGKTHIGKELTGNLPYRSVVDLDARFRLRGGSTREFRVIRVVIERDTRDGYLQEVDIWLVTNLAPADFSAEQVATLYRMRWEVEILFRALKSVGRLDQLHSASLPVIHAFLYASLLAVILAQDINAHMRRLRPGKEPSLYRVMTLLLGYLPHIVARLGTRYLRNTMIAFEAALWREGTNPNPGRPYAVEKYAWEVCHAR
jgi:putative transposase